MFKNLYDKQSEKWVRQEKVCLTDFTGRPAIIELCGNVNDKTILDLGCGEGYLARILKAKGAYKVIGYDVSEKMIEMAKQQEEQQPLGIDYHVADAKDLKLDKLSFDIVIAVFLFNYMNIEDTLKACKKVKTTLKKHGKFIIAIPHPFFPFIGSNQSPSYFDANNYNYFTGQDKLLEGKTWCIDGRELNVRLFHKSFADIFNILIEAGFNKLAKISEIRVTKELAEEKPQFFNNLIDVPLHLIIEIEA